MINEVLIRPRYDWEGKGGTNTGDEFIELYNLGSRTVNLQGWMLDDVAEAGSRLFEMPAWKIPAGSFFVVFRNRSRIALNDGGDLVRLLAPDGRVIDEISYLRIKAANLSYGRLPGGSSTMRYGLWPTPRKANLLFVEETPGAETEDLAANRHCPLGGEPRR